MRGLEKNCMGRGHTYEYINIHTSRLLDQLGPEGRVGENYPKVGGWQMGGFCNAVNFAQGGSVTHGALATFTYEYSNIFSCCRGEFGGGEWTFVSRQVTG